MLLTIKQKTRSKNHTPTLEDFFDIEVDPLWDQKRKMKDDWEIERERLKKDLRKLRRERNTTRIRSVKEVLDEEIEDKYREIVNWESLFTFQEGKGLEIKKDLIKKWGWENLFRETRVPIEN